MSVMLLVLLELYAVDTVFIDSLVTAADSGDALSTVGKGTEVVLLLVLQIVLLLLLPLRMLVLLLLVLLEFEMLYLKLLYAV